MTHKHCAQNDDVVIFEAVDVLCFFLCSSGYAINMCENPSTGLWFRVEVEAAAEQRI